MIDRLDSMRLLVRIVERGSFTAAAADIGVPRSTATEAISRLETRLGARLLERTTRHVGPTPDGEAYYRRCVAILAEVEEAEGALRGEQPSGPLRIDAHGRLTRSFILPRLPEFLEKYPLIDLHIGQGDRLVDLLREGVDCAIRAGDPVESGMIMRRLADIPEATVASPAYLERHGIPATPDDLKGHKQIGYVSSRSGAVMPLEFRVANQLREVSLPCSITANEADTMTELALMGYGLIQAPRYRFQADFEKGALVEVLPDYPPDPLPLAAYYPQNRQLAPRVRVFIDWIVDVFAKAAL